MTRTAKKYITRSDLLKPQIENYDQVGKVSSKSVEKHTGKDWKKWVSLLKKVNAETWTYQELVAFLKSKHRLSPWWQHGVALGFEIAIGRRRVGQDAKGRYMVTATKSLGVGVLRVWDLLVSKEGQKIWLQPFSEIEFKPIVQFETVDGYFGEVRTVTKGRRIRMYWQDPHWEKHTVVELMLVPKPGNKSILVFNHTGLKETKTQSTLRVRWRKAADEVGRALLGSKNR